VSHAATDDWEVPRIVRSKKLGGATDRRIVGLTGACESGEQEAPAIGV
jgi:hypothetical protein